MPLALQLTPDAHKSIDELTSALARRHSRKSPDGIRHVSLNLTESLHRRAKLLCVYRNVTLTDLLVEGLIIVLDQYEPSHPQQTGPWSSV